MSTEPLDLADSGAYNEHGQRITYNHGCRCQDCRDAAARYERGRQWDILRGQRRHLPIVGVRRRLQALYALGWTYNDQATYLCVANEMVYQWATCRTRVTRETFAKVAAMYDDLSMKLPPTETHQQRAKVAKARLFAARKGYAPPLCWDDGEIDDPKARPRGVAKLGHITPRKPDEDCSECPRCGVRRQVRVQARGSLCPDCRSVEREAS